MAGRVVSLTETITRDLGMKEGQMYGKLKIDIHGNEWVAVGPAMDTVDQAWLSGGSLKEGWSEGAVAADEICCTRRRPSIRFDDQT